jgi:hypothetical protein
MSNESFPGGFGQEYLNQLTNSALDTLTGSGWFGQGLTSPGAVLYNVGMGLTDDKKAEPGPKLMTITEMLDKRSEYRKEKDRARKETISRMKALLLRICNLCPAFDGRQTASGPDFIVHLDARGWLPYLVARVNHLQTRWEECETDGHRLDFAKRFLAAFPAWEEGFLELAKSEAREATDLLEKTKKVAHGAKYEE